MGYVLTLYNGARGQFSMSANIGFYNGSKYTFQGSVFACSCRNIDGAKIYTSKKRAENGLSILIRTTENVYEGEIREI